MYRIDETGVLNNYATLPRMYPAEYPSMAQQQSYVKQAVAAFSLVLTVLVMAVAVS